LCRTRSRCWRRKGTGNRGNRGLVESRLHEDHAEVGGNFEDEFAVALGAAVIVEGDERVDDGASAAGETFDAGAEGLGMRSVVLLARFADELGSFILWRLCPPPSIRQRKRTRRGSHPVRVGDNLPGFAAAMPRLQSHSKISWTVIR